FVPFTQLRRPWSMFHINCPQCRAKLKVPSKKQGRWIACPKCRMEFAANQAGEEQTEETPGYAYAAQSTRFSLRGAVAIVAGGLSLILAVGIPIALVVRSAK